MFKSHDEIVIAQTAATTISSHMRKRIAVQSFRSVRVKVAKLQALVREFACFDVCGRVFVCNNGRRTNPFDSAFRSVAQKQEVSSFWLSLQPLRSHAPIACAR